MRFLLIGGVIGLLGTALIPGPQTIEICAANIRNSTATCYDAVSGKPTSLAVKAGAGGLRAPTGIDFGPDGHLYVASSGTGEFIDVFVNDSAMVQPFTILFGPDQHLYVSSGARHVVVRYDGRSGQRLNIAARSDSLKTPIGLAFDRSGRLLVANAAHNNVSRFDPSTANRLDVLATDSLRFPSDLAIDADGDIYVSSAFNGQIMRFDGQTGSFKDIFGRLPAGGVPVGIRFLPSGELVAADFGKSLLFRFPRDGGPPTLLADQGLAGPENIVVRVRP
jgi:DNA-binding beta-propeller fold protein YncE